MRWWYGRWEINAHAGDVGRFDSLAELVHEVKHSGFSSNGWAEWSDGDIYGRWIVGFEDRDDFGAKRYDLFIERTDGKPLTRAERVYIHRNLPVMYPKKIKTAKR